MSEQDIFTENSELFLLWELNGVEYSKAQICLKWGLGEDKEMSLMLIYIYLLWYLQGDISFIVIYLSVLLEIYCWCLIWPMFSKWVFADYHVKYSGFD